MDRWATFDCYGTLIDWELGIGDVLSSLWPAADRARLLARYHEVEPRIQQGSGRPYREVLAAALAGVAEAEGREIPSKHEDVLADSLPSWPAFAEVPPALRELRGRGWKLALLGPLQYFGLVALLYYLAIALWLARERRLAAHVTGAAVAGIFGSLWWWISFGPWYFSVLHGAIWGTLVGVGAWTTRRSSGAVLDGHHVPLVPST